LDIANYPVGSNRWGAGTDPNLATSNKQGEYSQCYVRVSWLSRRKRKLVPENGKSLRLRPKEGVETALREPSNSRIPQPQEWH
jgi:hypothetical protein